LTPCAAEVEEGAVRKPRSRRRHRGPKVGGSSSSVGEGGKPRSRRGPSAMSGMTMRSGGGVKAGAFSRAEVEAAACSGARVEDGRWWRRIPCLSTRKVFASAGRANTHERSEC
jgi:hypothetical protein